MALIIYDEKKPHPDEFHGIRVSLKINKINNSEKYFTFKNKTKTERARIINQAKALHEKWKQESRQDSDLKRPHIIAYFTARSVKNNYYSNLAVASYRRINESNFNKNVYVKKSRNLFETWTEVIECYKKIFPDYTEEKINFMMNSMPDFETLNKKRLVFNRRIKGLQCKFTKQDLIQLCEK